MGYNLFVKINDFYCYTIAGIEVLPSPSSVYDFIPTVSLQSSPALTSLLMQSPSPTLEIYGELSSKLMYIIYVSMFIRKRYNTSISLTAILLSIYKSTCVYDLSCYIIAVTRYIA